MAVVAPQEPAGYKYIVECDNLLVILIEIRRSQSAADGELSQKNTTPTTTPSHFFLK